MTDNRKESAVVRFLYGTAVGRLMLKPLVSRAVSDIVGRFMSSSLSRPMIGGFVKKNGIDLDEYTGAPYRCFNDFFTRGIKPERRPFDTDPASLVCPCDGRLSAYRIKDGTVIPVKQSMYTVRSLLRDDVLAEKFSDGVCLVFRLCVDNYHRYSYFDGGVKGENVYIPGLLHTVRPTALEVFPVFVENSREYTVMETDNFGTAVEVEVGAMLVGRIANRHGEYRFSRGEEKGMFLYGGSTVMLLLGKGAAQIDEKYFAATENGTETPVKMGEKIGHR